jgi:hypothetical protein
MPEWLITFTESASKYIPLAQDVAIFIVGGLTVWFAKSYLAERAKNRALKRDNPEITRQSEEVKADFQARHSIRFAALDKRLGAHQEAFGLCRRMLLYANKPEKLEAVLARCQDWYNDHALYLEQIARSAFFDAHNAALQLHEGATARERKEHYLTINKSVETILQAVGLTPILGEQITPSASETGPEGD